jgi:hypothetical protein
VVGLTDCSRKVSQELKSKEKDLERGNKLLCLSPVFLQVREIECRKEERGEKNKRERLRKRQQASLPLACVTAEEIRAQRAESSEEEKGEDDQQWRRPPRRLCFSLVLL